MGNDRVFLLLQAIIGIVILQVRQSPLRKHNPLAAEEEIEAELRQLRAADAANEESDFPRGDVERDLIVCDDGTVRGRGPEPDPDECNTGMTRRDFVAGEKVDIWFWGKWWSGRIRYISRNSDRVTVSFDATGMIVTGYRTTHIRKLEQARN
mgnify:CR=1 FL=1